MSLWNQIEAPNADGFVQRLLATGGEIYGVILNDQASLDQLGDQLKEAPYKGFPKAPAMYIKPRNTIVGSGAEIELPKGETSVEVGAVLGVVMGKAASKVTLTEAADHIAGYVSVADLSLPHDSYYRPAIREKCFDGACPVGEPVVANAIADVTKLQIETVINGQTVARRDLSDLHRSIPQLLCDVTEFMMLKPGDILLTGVIYQAPQAHIGHVVRVRIAQVGSVEFRLQKAGSEDPI